MLAANKSSSHQPETGLFCELSLFFEYTHRDHLMTTIATMFTTIQRPKTTMKLTVAPAIVPRFKTTPEKREFSTKLFCGLQRMSPIAKESAMDVANEHTPAVVKTGAYGTFPKGILKKPRTALIECPPAPVARPVPPPVPVRELPSTTQSAMEQLLQKSRVLTYQPTSMAILMEAQTRERRGEPLEPAMVEVVELFKLHSQIRRASSAVPLVESKKVGNLKAVEPMDIDEYFEPMLSDANPVNGPGEAPVNSEEGVARGGDCHNQSAMVRKVLRAHRIRRPAKKQPTIRHPVKKQRLLGPDDVSEELRRVGFGLPENFRPYLPPMPSPAQECTDIDDNSLQMLMDDEDEATNSPEVTTATANSREVVNVNGPEVTNTPGRSKAKDPSESRRQTRSSTHTSPYWTRLSSHPTLRPVSVLRPPVRYVASF